MRPTFRSLVPVVLCLLSSAIANAQEEEAALPAWQSPGAHGNGAAEPQRRDGASRRRPELVDGETLEQVARLQQRLRRFGAHPHGPSLHFTVPLEPAARSRFPETRLSIPDRRSARAPNDFVFFKNTDPGTAISSVFRSTTNEPTVAARGSSVFFTGNWYAARSSNGGSSFSFVNPFTSPYAAVNDGFCCDQTTVYDPTTDTLFFLQQYIEDGSTGTQRINVDRNFDGVFECFYDFTPQNMGFGPNNWADFPDLAISNNHLYHASNVFSTADGGFTGGFVARYPLATMSACGFVNFWWYNHTQFGGFRFTRGATGTMYFASHISNASLRIWTWPEASTVPTSVDRSVTPWSDATRVCPGPDGRDWCGFIDARILGAYVASGVVGFMWVPAQDDLFPYPYTRIARFSVSGLTLIDEPPIWSTDTAWVYPSVAVNSNGDLGGTILFGGGAIWMPGCAAWLADDVNGDQLAPVDILVGLFGTTGPDVNRSGDYTMARRYYPATRTYVGSCFAYLSPTAGSPRYLHFGREKDMPTQIFRDGFESGRTSLWSEVSRRR